MSFIKRANLPKLPVKTAIIGKTDEELLKFIKSFGIEVIPEECSFAPVDIELHLVSADRLIEEMVARTRQKHHYHDAGNNMRGYSNVHDTEPVLVCQLYIRSTH